MIARAKAWWSRVVAPTLPARVFARYGAQSMSDRAAALTYYAMLSLFPALLFAVSVLGLVGGEGLVDQAVDTASDAGLSADGQQVVEDAVRTTLERSGGTLGLTLVVSLLLALNGASGVINAVGRALDVVFGAEPGHGRNAVKQRVVAIGVTLVLALLALVEVAATLLGGDLARDALDTVGLGAQAADVWSIARWPLALAAAAMAVAIVFRFAPSPDVARARVLTPGALTVVALWIVLTAAFSFYLRHFGDLGAVYGAFAGAVLLLLWLNLMATAFLLGAELDAVREGAPTQAPAAP